MGLFDDVSGALKGAAGQFEAAAMPALISAALAKTDLGDLQGLVAKLQQGGLNDQVKSWLGNDTTLPITSDQLRSALGNEQTKQLAERRPPTQLSTRLNWAAISMTNIFARGFPKLDVARYFSITYGGLGTDWALTVL